MTETSAEVIARAQRGEPAAIEILLGEVAPRVRRFGMRFCGATPDADDVFQDTLLAIAQHIDQYDGRASLASWVLALTRNACLRRRRGLKNQPPRADGPELPDERPNPEARAGERELLSAVRDALQELPVDAREVVLLRDVEGLSASEAATVLGISPQALKSRLHRARSALRERLRPLLEPDSRSAKLDGCPDVMALWSRKLEGELSRVDCADMESHLKTCAACSASCAALKSALDLCQRGAETSVPAELRARIKAATRAWAEGRGRTTA